MSGPSSAERRAEVYAAAGERCAADRAAAGLPRHVEDPVVLAKVARRLSEAAQRRAEGVS